MTTACAPPFLTNSASDAEDQQIDIHRRRQRRMLSNRESARRSRLRKQQHLDELRAHVTHLRAQNRQILSDFSAAFRKYGQIAEENRMLHSEAQNLHSQLQGLHAFLISNNHFDDSKRVVQLIDDPVYTQHMR
ncbi:hypothetical protein GOP47_0019065 [Adiantum capillus-veneris]|uniref:BZIP domain-containing protein n=1 Tax=Adiantum capillus-veneris TaxID=13818 RepID=A0A9D4UEF2_ADICA|nr:hypothetical protein GOP47_0019065 [Adiantum capillus-veneris]